MSSNTSAYDTWDSQFWGPVTATLDWCEANYQFTRYIAEAANTFSNFVTLGLAWYGTYLVGKANLPSRYLIGWMGFALVGLGSFIFHATLRFSAQLADELPMVYVASFCSAVLFDTAPGHDITNAKSRAIYTTLAAFDILFTWSYVVYRNPVYHQIVFASIMFTNAFRTAYLLRKPPTSLRIPAHDRQIVARLFSSGALTFAMGFFIWNLDNIFCTQVTRLKHTIGWPTAFLLEGHSWWHILTALGTYLMLVGNTYLTLGVKDSFTNYDVTWNYGLPGIARVRGNAKSVPAAKKVQ